MFTDEDNPFKKEKPKLINVDMAQNVNASDEYPGHIVFR